MTLNIGGIYMVDLRLKPYNLDDEGVKWVQDTIANMTIEEKIGQLFVNMGASRDEVIFKRCVRQLSHSWC